MLIEKIPTERLIPADYNPRKDLKPGDPEYEKLKRSLEEFGYVEPVIWNKTTSHVVGGHQRLKVLLDMGITEAECLVVEMDAEKEKALNVALNKISGDWDKDKLTLLIADLQGADFDVSLTGFDPGEIDDLFKDSLKDCCSKVPRWKRNPGKPAKMKPLHRSTKTAIFLGCFLSGYTQQTIGLKKTCLSAPYRRK